MLAESIAYSFIVISSFTWIKTGCLDPSSAPKAASIPNMAALELMSSGRSPENDMMSAEQIRGLTQWLMTENFCILVSLCILICSKVQNREWLNLEIFALHKGGFDGGRIARTSDA